MWYYIYISLLCIGNIFLSRLNSAYHPDIILKWHVNIKSKRLAKALIWQSNPFGGTFQNKKEYRSKITILGICSYIAWVALTIFSVCFLLWGPSTPIEPIQFDRGILCSTLNKAVVFISNILLLGFDISFYCLNISRCQDVRKYKAINIIWWFAVVFLFAICVIGVFMMIKLLI